MKIGLIGHSHAICLMDAIGPWRDQMGIAPSDRAAKPGYDKAFDGWDSVKEPMAIHLPGRRIGGLVADLVGVIAFGGSNDYDLVEVGHVKGKVVNLSPGPTLTMAAAAFQDCDVILSVTFGNELVQTVWLDGLPAYDFIEESVPRPFSKGAQIIDRRYIEYKLNGYVSRVMMTCIWLADACRQARIIHLMSPPPLEDVTGLAHLEGFNDAIRRHGVLDASLRLKWYRAYVRKMMAMLHPIGMTVLPPPMAVHTKDGYLRKELAIGLTHGNAQYGAMIWDAVAATIGARS